MRKAFLIGLAKASRSEAVTFNSRFGVDPGAIDPIFVARRGARRLTPIASELIFRSVDADSVLGSDHYGVVAVAGPPSSCRVGTKNPHDARADKSECGEPVAAAVRVA